MKVKEIDYTQYEYRRISVNNHHGVETFGLGAGADFLVERRLQCGFVADRS